MHCDLLCLIEPWPNSDVRQIQFSSILEQERDQMCSQARSSLKVQRTACVSHDEPAGSLHNFSRPPCLLVTSRGAAAGGYPFSLFLLLFPESGWLYNGRMGNGGQKLPITARDKENDVGTTRPDNDRKSNVKFFLCSTN